MLLARRNDLIRTLLLIVCLPILVQFVMLASEKPGEYARFGLLIDITLMLVTIVGAASVLKQNSGRLVSMGLLCAGCCVWSAGYVWHFGSDATARTSRIIGAQRLETLRKRGAAELAVYSDPAPYCLPPANLFEWKIKLLDSGAAPPSSADLLLKPVDEIPATNMPMRGYQFDYWTHPRLLDTPISWANKPFEAIVRRDFAGAADRCIGRRHIGTTTDSVSIINRRHPECNREGSRHERRRYFGTRSLASTLGMTVCFIARGCDQDTRQARNDRR